MTPNPRDLYWLPECPTFAEQLAAAKAVSSESSKQLPLLRHLAQHRLDAPQHTQISRLLQPFLKTGNTPTGFSRMRLALLASSTIDHLIPVLQTAALRKGLLLDCYTGEYNQYRQELLNPSSKLYAFHPDVVLLALDTPALSWPLPLNASAADAEQLIQTQVKEGAHLWSLAQKAGTTVIQQTRVIPPVQFLGHGDSQVPATPVALTQRLNDAVRRAASEQGVHLLDIDSLAANVGKYLWCDAPLWYHAKQAITPAFAPLYAEHVSRLLGALRGVSAKCLVLDLDNTLWGGVIGDDGLEQIELGQGTGVGEAFQAFQTYLKGLKDRGVLLAVCSKNEAKTARAPFEKHPEMKLHLADFSAFVANWEDKATNLRAIATSLNISLDSLVFFDDNPAERAMIRQNLPPVTVPEVPDDPADFIACLCDAGYFEAITLTSDDLARADHYQANQRRQELRAMQTDMEGFLKSLAMEMEITPFDDIGRPRIAQLINKSNQFNLTTRRYTEEQVRQIQNDPHMLSFQIRLKDVYGDNGMISVVILRLLTQNGKKGYAIDTWLMSCRVLGRQVEQAVLNSLADAALQRGADFLWGEYIPTEKNDLVREHYPRLGFKSVPASTSGAAAWMLPLASYKKFSTHIRCHFSERISHDAQRA